MPIILEGIKWTFKLNDSNILTICKDEINEISK